MMPYFNEPASVRIFIAGTPRCIGREVDDRSLGGNALRVSAAIPATLDGLHDILADSE
jgi:hypothetical protein